GLEGAGRSVSRVVGELKARREEELKPRSGRIRELARELREARRELQEAIARARGHGPLLLQEQEAEGAAAELAERIEAARSALGRSELLLRLWPVEARRREALRACERGGGGAALEALGGRFDALRGDRALQQHRRERRDALVAEL